MPDVAGTGKDVAGPRVERDGRRRRGQERRRSLVDAALTVIGREGLAAVSQRSVATQAGVPPSTVYYYFATLDDLIAAALVEVNDRFIARLDAISTSGDDPLRALAVATVEAARPGREEAMAELELWMLAARDERLRSQIDRCDVGIRTAAALLSSDPTVIDAVTSACTGYYWQAATSDRFTADDLEAILRHIVG
jgi:TetR/AcrR family transcriptional regulator, regulator of biofilm formation and stress response